MITIFHGADSFTSRGEFSNFIDQQKTKNSLRLDHKSADIQKINLFLNATSMFADPKLLILDNFFSVKKDFDKICQILNSDSENQIVIYADKDLSTTQLKTFPTAKINFYKGSNLIWDTINSIKYKKTYKDFKEKYTKLLQKEPFELFLYLLKLDLRKQLENDKIKKTYLGLIELEFQIKTGTLAIPKELALERTVSFLLN